MENFISKTGLKLNANLDKYNINHVILLQQCRHNLHHTYT